MKKYSIVFTLLVALFAAGCAEDFMRTRGGQGGIIGVGAGALLGQAIGNDTEATLLGAAIGGLLGYIIGNEMDKYDQSKVVHTIDTYPSGHTRSWQNPDSGNSFRVTPRPAYVPNPRDPDRVCREAEVRAYIRGEEKVAYTTACYEPYDGKWYLK